jgi:outer membrane protein
MYAKYDMCTVYTFFMRESFPVFLSAIGARTPSRKPVPTVFLLCAMFCAASPSTLLRGQCAKQIVSSQATIVCLQGEFPVSRQEEIESGRAYTLTELIDIAERHHPQTRQAWERGRQAAERLRIARSVYFPELALLAYFGDERIINPFPKPLAPRGYTMAEIPVVVPSIALEYVLFDSGQRHAQLDRSRAGQLAAVAAFQRSNQEVAYRVVRAYYNLLTDEQQLAAAHKILSTTETTEDAAEARLKNGESTLPDVLNARAARAQATYDLESADGAVRLARVTLRESLGMEPSEQIEVMAPAESPTVLQVTESIEALVALAHEERPDLKQLQENLQVALAEIRQAKAKERPALTLTSKIGQTALWPTTDYGQLGSADQTTWNVGVNFHWNLFAGGKLRAEDSIAQSRAREQAARLTERNNEVTREVWDAYLTFRTAERQCEASIELLDAAETSYNASLDAYRYGVKNLIDVVTAEKQLAMARVAHVQAESSIWNSAASLEYVTGYLLHGGPPLTTSVTTGGNAE